VALWDTCEGKNLLVHAEVSRVPALFTRGHTTGDALIGSIIVWVLAARGLRRGHGRPGVLSAVYGRGAGLMGGLPFVDRWWSGVLGCFVCVTLVLLRVRVRLL